MTKEELDRFMNDTMIGENQKRAIKFLNDNIYDLQLIRHEVKSDGMAPGRNCKLVFCAEHSDGKLTYEIEY